MDNVDKIIANHHNLLKERKVLKRRKEVLVKTLLSVKHKHPVTLKTRSCSDFVFIDNDLAEELLSAQLDSVSARLEAIEGFFVQADNLCKPDNL